MLNFGYYNSDCVQGILDTHVGSASSLIAFEEKGLNYIGFEIDPDYYEAGQRRLEEFRQQIRFDFGAQITLG